MLSHTVRFLMSVRFLMWSSIAVVGSLLVTATAVELRATASRPPSCDATAPSVDGAMGSFPDEQHIGFRTHSVPNAVPSLAIPGFVEEQPLRRIFSKKIQSGERAAVSNHQRITRVAGGRSASVKRTRSTSKQSSLGPRRFSNNARVGRRAGRAGRPRRSADTTVLRPRHKDSLVALFAPRRRQISMWSASSFRRGRVRGGTPFQGAASREGRAVVETRNPLEGGPIPQKNPCEGGSLPQNPPETHSAIGELEKTQTAPAEKTHDTADPCFRHAISQASPISKYVIVRGGDLRRSSCPSPDAERALPDFAENGGKIGEGSFGVVYRARERRRVDMAGSVVEAEEVRVRERESLRKWNEAERERERASLRLATTEGPRRQLEGSWRIMEDVMGTSSDSPAVGASDSPVAGVEEAAWLQTHRLDAFPKSILVRAEDGFREV